MSTYIPSFNNERINQPSSPESLIPIENLIMCIPNVNGVHDSGVSQQPFCESSIGLLRDSTSHEIMDQMVSRIPPSGIGFHSDHDHCVNTIVDFPLAYENSQDSKSYLHGIGNVISDSKYLKATQNLLDDVVNVKKAMKQHCKHDYMNNSKEAFGILKNRCESSPVSASEKQDLQNNMTKLSSMLNEVSFCLILYKMACTCLNPLTWLVLLKIFIELGKNWDSKVQTLTTCSYI